MSDIRPIDAGMSLADLHDLMVSTYRTAYQDDMAEDHLTHHLETVLAPARVAEMRRVDRFWIAHLEDTPVGYVQLGDAPKDLPVAVEPGDLAIRRAYVAAPHQGRGLGTALLDTAIAAASATAQRLFIDVWETNHGARRLYERLGFVRVGEVPEYDLAGRRTGSDQILVKTLRHAGR